MKRGYMVGLGIAAGAGAAAVLGRRQIAAALGLGAAGAKESQPQQWPFDGGELRTLMDRTLEEQRAIVAEAPDTDSRARAEAFARYYEGRRAAAVGR